MEAIFSRAADSYAQARMAAAPAPSSAEHGPNFASFAQDFTSSLAHHEAVARAAMTGSTDPHALVEALASSQMAVETVATIRDRVVEAYQEILRMPV